MKREALVFVAMTCGIATSLASAADQQGGVALFATLWALSLVAYLLGDE